MSTRKELYRTSCQEYRKAGKKERGEILDRLTGITGMNRDYLAAVLRNCGRKVQAVIDGKAVEVEAGGRKKAARKKRERGKRGGRPFVRETAGAVYSFHDRFSGGGAQIWHNGGYIPAFA
jgi:hypothetical protein